RVDLSDRVGRPRTVPERPDVLRSLAAGEGGPPSGGGASMSDTEPDSWSLERARKALAERSAARALETLYRRADAAWSGFRCPASAECCQLSKRGREPWLWGVEWDTLRRAAPALPPVRPDGGCRFLDAEGRRCTVYASRPLGCRTYFCHRATGPGREPVEQ